MALIEQQFSSNVTTGDQTSLTATYGVTPTQNNLLVAVGAADVVATMASTGWSLARSQVADLGFYLWYKIAGASESTAVQMTMTAASAELAIFEYSGNVTVNPLDQATGATGAAGVEVWTSGTTGTTAQADELAIAAYGWNDSSGGNFTATSYTNSFAERTELKGTGTVATNLSVATRALSGTGTVESTVSGTGTFAVGHTPSGIIVTFKAAAGSVVTATAAIAAVVAATAAGAAVALQQLRPDADTVVTGWTPSTGTDVYAVINDVSDSTYASASLS